jgi:hypothetical protein
MVRKLVYARNRLPKQETELLEKPRKIRNQKSSPKRHQLGLMGESWIKIMGFNNDCPGDTNELTGTSHTGDFVGFAAREQPLINR